jgi:hypothetical protein
MERFRKSYFTVFTGFAAFIVFATPRAGALTAGREVLRLLSVRFCQKTRIGLAINIDEYVPTIIPTTNANENPLSTCPPNKNREMAVKKVSPEVSTVRLSV